jgi:hypothetical protein
VGVRFIFARRQPKIFLVFVGFPTFLVFTLVAGLPNPAPRRVITGVIVVVAVQVTQVGSVDLGEPVRPVVAQALVVVCVAGGAVRTRLGHQRAPLRLVVGVGDLDGLVGRVPFALKVAHELRDRLELLVVRAALGAATGTVAVHNIRAVAVQFVVGTLHTAVLADRDAQKGPDEGSLNGGRHIGGREGGRSAEEGRIVWLWVSPYLSQQRVKCLHFFPTKYGRVYVVHRLNCHIPSKQANMAMAHEEYDHIEGITRLHLSDELRDRIVDTANHCRWTLHQCFHEGFLNRLMEIFPNVQYMTTEEITKYTADNSMVIYLHVDNQKYIAEFCNTLQNYSDDESYAVMGFYDSIQVMPSWMEVNNDIQLASDDGIPADDVDMSLD